MIESEIYTLTPFPLVGILFRKKHIPPSKKLTSLGVRSILPDGTEVRLCRVRTEVSREQCPAYKAKC